MAKPTKRCVNIDWLEVYVLEDCHRYPMNADYFRRLGYFVQEREYGTRTYKEMFTIEDKDGNGWMEVRRNPASGASDFTGLQPESCHLRLTNAYCYRDDAVSLMRDFILMHGYTFQRIFRIDVCYDFEYFDTGDQPERFARRYIEQVYRKINQCKLSVVGDDEWTDFAWESLKWGNEKSMVSTKLYNKTKEIASPKRDKPYIRFAWFVNDLVDDPISMTKTKEDGSKYKPDIWRIEFSMKSSARNWIVIENNDGKTEKKDKVPHRLELFDSRDKMWLRFQELAHHYFHFKYKEYVDAVDSDGDPRLKRKNLCRDKQLFYYDTRSEFMKLQQLPKASKPVNDDEILRRRLMKYQSTHLAPEVHKACEVILASIRRFEVARLCDVNDPQRIDFLRDVIALKSRYPDKELQEVIEAIQRMTAGEIM